MKTRIKIQKSKKEQKTNLEEAYIVANNLILETIQMEKNWKLI